MGLEDEASILWLPLRLGIAGVTCPPRDWDPQRFHSKVPVGGDEVVIDKLTTLRRQNAQPRVGRLARPIWQGPRERCWSSSGSPSHADSREKGPETKRSEMA